MPRSLVSFWKRVATSGPTVDGRDILPQDLRDIAETYKPSTYTAVIWCDHERWPGSHGTVYAVRLVEEADDLAPGQVALEAQLKPNDKLLWLNDQGEKLFSSIEITPNFANTGKAYLTGLAVTDEPASLGTQELYFSKRSSRTSYYAASQELGPLTTDEPKGEVAKLVDMLTSFFKRFADDKPSADTPNPTTESNPPMDEATATALKALRDQMLVVVAGLDAVVEGAAADAPEPDQDLIEDVQTAVDEIVTTAEEDREYRRTRRQQRKQTNFSQRLLDELKQVRKDFKALTDAPAGRQLPRTSAPAQQLKTRVL
ncbi:MAG: GPO family capsid scaffolding protein [Pseudomonas sp.]|uniref:GPO family capsid scaffolding protein n=1 Tax=Pseudomonas TaxID=286 RepID=UPI0003C0A757|nr:GPO family capsid scaffolding protein [Pseudomonas sp. VLB120]AGZ37589.1 scaffold protein [Pseudomonas sp. VLB120]